LRDPTKAKSEVLDKVLESSSRQLEESTKNVDEIRSIILLHWVKSPKERTAINMILDDQKKVVKALSRLVDDLAEICNQYV
jgi:hypothetical protein